MSPNEFAAGVEGALRLVAVGSALPGVLAGQLKRPAPAVILGLGLGLGAILLLRHATALRASR